MVTNDGRVGLTNAPRGYSHFQQGQIFVPRVATVFFATFFFLLSSFHRGIRVFVVSIGIARCLFPVPPLSLAL